MSIKPRLTTQLHVKQGLSPQLHHSIRLISLPAVELLAEIQQALDENPFLESSQDLDPWDTRVISAAPREGIISHGESDYWLESANTPETLQSHLRWQANLTPLTNEERVLAEMIIESINEEGYLSAPLHEILPNTLANDSYELAHSVLHRIQQFDPPGVGAQDLRECLSIQLSQIEPQDSLVRKAMDLIFEDLEKIQADPEVLRLIQSLHPKPGLLYGEVKSEHLIPDLIVRQEGDTHQVYLNDAVIPSLQLNLHYAHALKMSREKNQPLQDQLNAAKSLIYHMSLRQNTLLSVARCIVKAQQDFFHEGPQGLKPLKLEDISYATQLHPSTVSRLTCNKYIHTARGLFALKYFLCGGVQAEHGVLSSRAVQALIAQLVVQEDKAQPLSDQTLVDKLAESGILIARRTVAKYREALRIPTKSLRKLKQANQE
jgi:RNA polymerase sigma-54 factor